MAHERRYADAFSLIAFGTRDPTAASPAGFQRPPTIWTADVRAGTIEDGISWWPVAHLDGTSTASLPLIERKQRLQRLFKRKIPGLRFNEHIADGGPKFYGQACKMDLEGVISKRVDRPYAPGDRGIWLKTKCLNHEGFVVVGWTDPEGSRPHLGALLLLGYCIEDGQQLLYAGMAGAGMNMKELARMAGRLKPLAVAKMPLSEAPPRESRFGSPLVLSRVHLVRPEMVVEVTYLTWTGAGLHAEMPLTAATFARHGIAHVEVGWQPAEDPF